MKAKPNRKPKVDKNLYAVIMAGGKGTRFWPLSRETFPKQFLKIVGERTLIQETIHRLHGEVKPANTLIVTTKGQSDIVRWQLMEILDDVKCVIEPEGRNTAPAIALAAYKLHKKNPNSVMLVLPSDHHISDTEAFRASVRQAAEEAENGSIVTFGIRPTRPETGYGYIKTGRRLRGGVYRVQKFVEKPVLRKAKAFLKEGIYYWNSGMFMFKTSVMIEEFKLYMPELHEAFEGVRAALNTKKEDEALAEIYGSLDSVSIDYGIMENSKKVTMLAAAFPWSDIGSWSALDEVLERDSTGNVSLGNVVGIDCKDSIFFGSGSRLIAALGLKDMVVVDTADATLITPKDKVQRVKDLVGTLKEEGKEEYLSPRVEDRPWGYFSVLEKGPNHQIKHIYIKPKAKISLQKHIHRSEHWIVVAGTAKVQRGEEVFFVKKNESTFIPATVMHRLENPGTAALRIIEIQSGEYLGEDDIIRVDDSYGRKTK
jgi:mannose-1-phosphate guanylyltransferase/mannose-6-phosphate isomerase